MNWDEINTLLSVIHQASAAGPKFAAIAKKATEELLAEFAPPAKPVPLVPAPTLGKAHDKDEDNE